MSNEEKLRYFLRKVSTELDEAQGRVRELEAKETEPIAVVGIGCRFPGSVRSADDLWELVATGTDAVSEFPSDRGWDLNNIFGSGLDDGTYKAEGGFLYDAGDFDADFFGISPREALATDPQQRVLLETAWETFEHVGIDPEALRGSKTGVFVGTNGQDYPALLGGHPELEAYLSTGSAAAVASGRIAYTFGLEGPALTVDTACSSSLVSLHLAAEALRRGEATLALAGGVTIMSTPGMFAGFSQQQGLLAADGRCKSFAASADGTGFSEGIGLVLVERLSDALRNGHDVLAVLRGSAVNQDGASNGLTAPNGPSQQRVIRQALAATGLPPEDVDLVEAHGTGTVLGDPIEAQALLATYGTYRPADRPLRLGSIKSNIGHTQAAAGIAGVIKVVQAIRHGVLPKTLHADEPTSHVDWSAGAVELLTENVDWSADSKPRRAGVSSFGFSGTNAHVILEQAPEPEPVAGREVASESEPGSEEAAASQVAEDVVVLGAASDSTAAAASSTTGPVPWMLSGVSQEALRAQAGRLLAHVQDRPGLSPVDVGYSLATTRARLEHRAVVVAEDAERLRSGLAAVAEGVPAHEVVRGTAAAKPGVVFVFPGQGTHWAGMAVGLLDTSPSFAGRFAECAAALEPYVDWSPEEVLRQVPGAPELDRVDVVQPVLWAVMVSLAAVWRSYGVEPSAVVGHSQGEVAAACVSGALSLADGAKVVALRSRALVPLAGRGGMLAIVQSADWVAERIEPFEGRVSIAAVNGPSSVVVSGDLDALGELEVMLSKARVMRWFVPGADFSAHSHQVGALEGELAESLAGVTPRSSRVPFCSTLTGEVLDTEQLDAGYWYRNLRHTVDFEAATRTLLAEGNHVFVEVSPHPVLSLGLQETFGETGAVALGTLRRDEDESRRLLLSLAQAHANGVGVDWSAVFAGSGASRVELPTYAFQRRRFWLTSATGSLGADRVDGTASTVDSWRYRVSWRQVADVAPETGVGERHMVVVPADGSASGIAEDCVSALADTDVCVLEVEPDDDRESITRAVREIAGEDGASFGAVLSLLAFDERPRLGHDFAPSGYVGTLLLAQALGDASVTAPLWIATSGAVSTGAQDSVEYPAQAMLWGFGAVLGAEQPERWGGLIDLPGRLDEDTGRLLHGVLTGRTHAENQLAIRTSGLYVRRLVHAPLGGTEQPSWTPTGTVLITGGTGALGSHVARWLARSGAEHLLLVGRRGLEAPGAADLVAELAEQGTRVTVVACDASDRDALAEVIADVPEEYPLTTVIHAAALLDDGLIDTLSVDQVERALLAKVVSVLNLHELTRHIDVTAFLLFSSIGGLFGVAGQGNYAPGNAFLDAFAQYRRAQGLPGTAIAWGHWAGGGIGEGAVEEAFAKAGLRPMDPELAVSALRQVIEHDETSLVVADWQGERTAGQGLAPDPLVYDLPEFAGAPQQADTVIASRVYAATGAQRRRVVLDAVLAEVAVLLGHDSAGDVPEHRSFQDLGFTSLTSLELRNRLAATTGLNLPATLVFDYPTPVSLADYLLADLVGEQSAEPDTTVAAVTGDPVVIVGMSCRFPGGVAAPEDLWRLVDDGVDAVTGFPTDRGWDLAALYHPEPGQPGKTYVDRGAFLHDVAEFDPLPFGISPREALAMDPQQRLLLETSWEALERSGIAPESLRGSHTAVFAGTNGQDYGYLMAESGDEVGGYIATGSSASVLSGRIAYTFGFEGPAVTVDTACSSSLVALHWAAQALRNGECGLALAGGVTVTATPGVFIEFSRQRGLAPDGRCKAFADAADGTGWGEGAGMLVLERLSDARRNGHPVLAVVRGSAVNSDGASNGLTAPNGTAQQQVIRQALASADLGPADVDAVEAHGTGTTLGDPIEAQALLATYGREREADRPLLVGSVKSNIGHTQAASGAAGVIKMVQAMRHGVVPKTLHVDQPSSHVDWSAGRLSLSTDSAPWPGTERGRRAAVSSFGISGTNAHVIVEQPEEISDPVRRDGISPPVIPWTLSAKSGEALRAQAASLLSHLESSPELDPVDVAWSLATTRSPLEHRSAVLGGSRDELRAGLAALAEGETPSEVVTGSVTAGRSAVLFPGQGTQRPGMGRELHGSYPVFANAFDEVCARFGPYLDERLDDVVLGESALLDETAYTQAGLFAVEVALYRLVESWGLVPDFLLGHSIGELSAAHVAGVLSLDDATALVAARGTLMQALPRGGAMVSVRAAEETVLSLLTDRVSLAAVNGPESVVLSGDEDAVLDIAAQFGTTRRLRVSHAFHSPRMDAMLDDFRAVAEGLSYQPPRIPIVSNVTGDVVPGELLCDPDYWVRHVRDTVRFRDGISTLHTKGVRTFVELGPGGALSAMGRECPAPGAGTTGNDVAFVPALRKDRAETETVNAALAAVHTRGTEPDWAAFFAGTGARRVDLPTYAFQRERYWPTIAPSDSSIADRRRYRIEWHVPELEPAPPFGGTWIVVLPEDGAARRVTEWLVDGLAARGGVPVPLTVTGRTRRDELASLLTATAAAHSETAGVVSLLGMVPEPDPGATLSLVQALADSGMSAPLWLLTEAAVSTGDHDPVRNAPQAQLWGLGRVIGLEMPQVWGGLVDLPSSLTDEALDRLCAVLSGRSEDQVALRTDRMFARRLVRAESGGHARAWAPRGTVLITGGTGALGGHVARWAAGSGATHVVLVSRQGDTAPGASDLRAELLDLGVEVTIAACDVTDRTALVSLVDTLGDVHAVVHAAGVAHLTPLSELSQAELSAVCAGKVAGAAALDAVFERTQLDAFVLFSSISGIWGSAGQGAYAAANAYLDALASQRRARGVAATSIAWGPWDDGMTELEFEELLRDRGISVMTPASAVAALQQALAEDDAAMTIAEVDWNRFASVYTALRPSTLFSALVGVAQAETTPERGTTRFDGLPRAERAAALLELVRGEAARVLGHRDSGTIDTETVFHELGFDSLTAVELRDRLAAGTGLDLPASLVFDYPAPDVLVRHLESRLSGRADAVATPAIEMEGDDDPIAVIGMSCRLPGGVGSPEALWRLLETAGDAVSGFPKDRGWELGPTAGFTRVGGFLHDAADFDAEFFGISPREALAMDPQQRLLLEASWEAIERAGVDPESLRGSKTGVFAGAAALGYGAGADSSDVEGHLLTGNATSVLSGRVAYTFGFEGPAVTLDTACSSSLVALHWAVQALRNGECGLALAGGATVMANADTFTEFARQGGLAADGRCKSFAASADGTGWSEGVGVLLVERLSDARRNGHEVLAVVRGSAVNQDGASNGLTAPNGPSQQRVIRQALANARLDPSDVDAVEAHGTGTSLGDPIEAQALMATYGRDRDRPLWLGSLKSNIGHAQAAAGVAGIIKVITAMRHGVLPQTLHVDEPTPRVDWSAGAVRLLAEPVPWPADGHTRRAAVSAFGISGTNAHTIIESPPEPEPSPACRVPAAPLLLSAHSDDALRAQAAHLLAYRDEHPETPVADVAHTLATGRSRFQYRAAVHAADPAEVTLALQALANGEGAPGLATGHAGTGPAAFLFSGQGSQRAGMGRELYEAHPVFAEAFDAVCTDKDVVFGEGDLLDQTEYTQIGLFAVEVALFRLVESWGVVPNFLLGHSIGELAAAHVAGVLSIEDAVTLVTARGRLMQALPSGGAMVSLQATEAEVAPLLSPRVCLAAVNGPESVVVSGDEDAVAEVVARFGGRKTKRLKVSHAFHSARMDPMLDDFRAVAENLTFSRPEIPVVSTVTGRVATDELTDPGYWVRQVRETVRFADGLRSLDEHGVAAFLELGPETSDPAALANAIARAHVGGMPVNWHAFFSSVGSGHRADLPTYPFQRERFWLAPPRGGDTDSRFWSAVERQDLAALGGLAADQPLSEALPALLAWRHRGANLSTVDSWRYRVDWRQHTGGAMGSRPRGTWLVVSTGGRDAATLVDGLRSGGAQVIEVSAPADPASLAGHTDLAGVVALPGQEDDAAASALALLQALEQAEVQAPLWCLTRGAVSATVDDAPTDPDQAQVWGLGRVAALELPGRWGGLLDLPDELDDRAVEQVLRVLAGAGEDQVAVRPSGIFARRVTRADGGEGQSWRTGGTALVTGGTGALGKRVARWLADRGAEHVVLVSRRGDDAPGVGSLRDELADMDVRVTVAACDVADRTRLADLRAKIEAGGDRFRTVVHAAGTGTRLPIAATSTAELSEIRDGKVAGAENLDAEFADDSLDAFVLFSSVAGVWGSGSQGAYAAANAALDALAERRRAAGRTATAIAWGPWADEGMAGGADAEEHLGRRGLSLMAPDRALLALEQALADDETAITVADLDWERFAPAFTALRASTLFDDIPDMHDHGAVGPDTVALDRAEALRETLADAKPAEQDHILLDLVRREAAGALGYRGGDAIKPHTGFVELGFDSLTAVELRNRVTRATGLPLPATLIFDYPNATALADHLRTGMAPETGGDPSTELGRLERALATCEPHELDPQLHTRMRALVDKWVPAPAVQEEESELRDASSEDMFEIIQREFGKSP